MSDNHECHLNRDVLPMTLTPGVFELVAPYQPAGDQPAAIDALVRGIE